MNTRLNIPQQQQEESSHSLFYCDLCKEEVSFAPHGFKYEEHMLCIDCAKSIAFGYFEHIHERYEADYYAQQHQEELRYRDSLRAPSYRKKTISHSMRMQVYERDGFACVTCGVQKNLSLDHIKPEVLGGESTIENLQTMCKSCNSRKGARYVEATD